MTGSAGSPSLDNRRVDLAERRRHSLDGCRWRVQQVESKCFVALAANEAIHEVQSFTRPFVHAGAHQGQRALDCLRRGNLVLG